MARSSLSYSAAVRRGTTLPQDLTGRHSGGDLVEVHSWVVICRCGWHSRSATREGAEMLADHHRRLGGRHEPVINER
jgi:hypothetical protein